MALESETVALSADFEVHEAMVEDVYGGTVQRDLWTQDGCE